MSDIEELENVGGCNSAAKSNINIQPNDDDNDDFISLSDIAPVEKDSLPPIFGQNGVQNMLGDDEDQLDLDKVPPLPIKLSVSQIPRTNITSDNNCEVEKVTEASVIEDKTKDVAQGTISSSTDLCTFDSNVGDIQKYDILSENIVSTSETSCIDAEIISPKKRGRKPKQKRGRKPQTDKHLQALGSVPIPKRERTPKNKTGVSEFVPRRSSRTFMKKVDDNLLDILQDNSPSKSSLKFTVECAMQDMSFNENENSDNDNTIKDIKKYINDTNIDNHVSMPKLNDNLNEAQTETPSECNLEFNPIPSVKEKSKRGRKRKTQISVGNELKPENEIVTVPEMINTFLLSENANEQTNEEDVSLCSVKKGKKKPSIRGRKKKEQINENKLTTMVPDIETDALIYHDLGANVTINTDSGQTTDDDELSLSHIKKLNSFKINNDPNVLVPVTVSSDVKLKSKRGRKRKTSPKQNESIAKHNSSTELLSNDVPYTNDIKSDQTQNNDEICSETIVNLLDEGAQFKVTDTKTEPPISKNAEEATNNEMDIDDTVGESILLADSSDSNFNEVTISEESDKYQHLNEISSEDCSLVNPDASYTKENKAEKLVTTKSIEEIGDKVTLENDAASDNKSVEVVYKESPAKRTSKKTIMNDYEYDIDKVISPYSKSEDILYSEDGRPLRRKARQKHYNEIPDEDPYANVELSDDESDAEYIPDVGFHVESSSRKKVKVQKTFELESPTTEIFDNFNNSSCVIELGDDVENNLEASVIRTKSASDDHIPAAGLSDILGKKSLGTGLEIKKVVPKDGSQLPPITIPVLVNKCDIDTQTNVTKLKATSAQTVSAEPFKLKSNVTLTNKQKAEACDFLTKILNTTTELGNLMTQKSDEFISKKINPTYIKDTARIDYCTQKAFLLLKLAKDNINSMEENLNKKYEEFLSTNNLLSSFEKEKTITPQQPDQTSDSDCEIVEESIPAKKTKVNPKTVFLNKELSIKIAKKPSIEPSKKQTPIQKPQKGNKVHSVWINDSIMVKKVKPQDSFLAKDSRNDKPPDIITEAQVKNFFDNYYLNNVCAQLMSPEWIHYKPHNSVITCNYFTVEAPVLHTELNVQEENAEENFIEVNDEENNQMFNDSYFPLSLTNKDVNQEQKVTDTLSTLCLEAINKKILKAATNCDKNIALVCKNTGSPRSLLQLTLESMANHVKRRQESFNNIDKKLVVNLNKTDFEITTYKPKTLLQLSIEAINNSIYKTNIINAKADKLDINLYNPKTLLQLCLEVVRENEQPVNTHMIYHIPDKFDINLYNPKTLLQLCLEVVRENEQPVNTHMIYHIPDKFDINLYNPKTLLQLCVEVVRENEQPVNTHMIYHIPDKFDINLYNPKTLLQLCLEVIRKNEQTDLNLISKLPECESQNTSAPYLNNSHDVAENIFTKKVLTLKHICCLRVSAIIGLSNEYTNTRNEVYNADTEPHFVQSLLCICLETIRTGLYPQIYFNDKPSHKVNQHTNNVERLSTLSLDIISNNLYSDNDFPNLVIENVASLTNDAFMEPITFPYEYDVMDNNDHDDTLHKFNQCTVKSNVKTLSSLSLNIVLNNITNNDISLKTLRVRPLKIDKTIHKSNKNNVKALSSLCLDIISNNLYTNNEDFPSLVIENVASIQGDAFMEPIVFPRKTEVIDDNYDDNVYDDDFFDGREENWHSNIELGDLRSCTEPIRTEISANVTNVSGLQTGSSVQVKLEVEECRAMDSVTIKQEPTDFLNQFLENNDKDIKKELLGELETNNVEGTPIDSFEDFLRNNSYAQGVISGTYEQTIQRPFEIDNMSSDYDSDTGMRLLVPMAYQPVEIRPNGEVIYKSIEPAEGDKNKGKNNNKKGRRKKAPAKDCDNNTTDEQLKNITKKLKDKINDKEEDSMSSDFEIDLPLKKSVKENSNLEQVKPVSATQEFAKSSNDAPEIQCNSVDSTQNMSLPGKRKRGRPKKIDKKNESCVKDIPADVPNNTCDAVKEIAEQETDEQSIKPEPETLDYNIEIEIEEIVKNKNEVKESKEEMSNELEKVKFTERNEWHCYQADKNDIKLYHPCSVMLEKLPEDFVNTYFKYVMMSNNDVEYNDEDMEIMRLTNLNNLNRLTRSKGKDKSKHTKANRTANVNKEDGDDTTSDYDYPEMELSDDERPLKENNLSSLQARYNGEDALAKNLLMAEEGSDDGTQNDVQKDIGVEEQAAPKTRCRPGPKSKKKQLTDDSPVILTVDKMMKRELELLHAPVVLEDYVKPKTEIDSKEDIKFKPTPSNPTRKSHRERKQPIIGKDDSSSEEEKLWVNTKSKLLKRMEKKISQKNSVDDERRTKIVTEYLERNSAMPSTSKTRRRLSRRKRREILLRQIGEAGDSLNALVGKKSGNYSKGRKNIRKVLDKKSLAKSTVKANMEEFERKKRINYTQSRLRQIFNYSDSVNVVVINNELCLEFDFETSKPTVTVHKFFTKVMKDHQYEGVKFLWDACFESLAHIKSGSPGGGCILAHCMGLGKTLQVLALLHTVLTHPHVGIQRVLVCCPLSTVLNWVDEINKWMGPITNKIKVFELSKLKKIYERAYQLEDWFKNGGIFIIGYELFRSLSTIDPELDDVRPTIVEKLRRALLDPGPDIIVCDEGHLLKNDSSVLAIAMSRVKTKRRIVLTGTPMQNNLREYFCMVNFVKPNLLGTYNEYSNRFENPIMNGQHRDSSIADIKLMKARTFILHKVLEGCLQRQEASVLYPYLPRKYEYTVFIALTKCQSSLYKHYLDEYSRKSKQSILKDFHVLQKIWSHPLVLHNFLVKRGDELEIEREIKLEDDLAREDLGADRDIKPLAEEVWWLQYLEEGAMLNTLEASNKFDTLFRILDECVQVDDKVLIFSTSLFTMDALEFFLKKIKNWSLGHEYYRLDGSVPAEVRQKWCREFNAENNTKTKLFLISTRAGCLGLNMTAANRVILFDTSWNPAHDIQSIFRVYRFGQKKDCYIYRLVAMGTMEQKIYERSVTKQAVACRVVDEQEIDRHYNMADLGELYRFDETGSGIAGGLAANISDLVLLRVARHPTAFYSVHEHDSLLRDTCEQHLPENERQEAWDQFQKEQTDKHMLSNAEASLDRPAERKQKNNPSRASIKRISLKVPENDEVAVTQPKTNDITPMCDQPYDDHTMEIITPEQNTPIEENPDPDNEIINQIASMLIKHRFNKPDADKTVSGLASIVSTLISEQESSKFKTRRKEKTEQVVLAESIVKILQKHVGDESSVDPQPSTSKAHVQNNDTESEIPKIKLRNKRKSEFYVIEDDSSATHSIENEAQPQLPKKKKSSKKTITVQEIVADMGNQSLKPSEESKKDEGQKKLKTNLQVESRRRQLQKIEVQSEVFELSDDEEIVPEVIEPPKEIPIATNNPFKVYVIPEKVLKSLKDTPVPTEEPCPLNPEILQNNNFSYIVANIYQKRNPDLNEHSAKLAAEYSIKSVLDDSEKTNKPITSGPIYDIALKLLGKDAIKALWDKKIHGDETTTAVESTTSPKQKVVKSKRLILKEKKSDAPQTPITSKDTNVKDNQTQDASKELELDCTEVTILPDEPYITQGAAKSTTTKNTLKMQETIPRPHIALSSGKIILPTNEPIGGTDAPIVIPNDEFENTKSYMTSTGQIIKLRAIKHSQQQISIRPQGPILTSQGSIVRPQGPILTSQGSIVRSQGTIITSQGSLHRPQEPIMSSQVYLERRQEPIISSQASPHRPQEPIMSSQVYLQRRQQPIMTSQASPHIPQEPNFSSQGSLLISQGSIIGTTSNVREPVLASQDGGFNSFKRGTIPPGYVLKTLYPISSDQVPQGVVNLIPSSTGGQQYVIAGSQVPQPLKMPDEYIVAQDVIHRNTNTNNDAVPVALIKTNYATPNLGRGTRSTVRVTSGSSSAPRPNLRANVLTPIEMTNDDGIVISQQTIVNTSVENTTIAQEPIVPKRNVAKRKIVPKSKLYKQKNPSVTPTPELPDEILPDNNIVPVRLIKASQPSTNEESILPDNAATINLDSDEDDMPLLVHSTPALVKSAEPTTVKSTPKTTVKSTPTATVKSTPTATVKSTPTATVKSTPTTIVKSTPKITVDSTLTTTVKSTPTTTVKSTPKTTVKSTPTTTVRSTPTTIVKSTPPSTVQSATQTLKKNTIKVVNESVNHPTVSNDLELNNPTNETKKPENRKEISEREKATNDLFDNVILIEPDESSDESTPSMLNKSTSKTIVKAGPSITPNKTNPKVVKPSEKVAKSSSKVVKSSSNTAKKKTLSEAVLLGTVDLTDDSEATPPKKIKTVAASSKKSVSSTSSTTKKPNTKTYKVFSSKDTSSSTSKTKKQNTNDVHMSLKDFSLDDLEDIIELE